MFMALEKGEIQMCSVGGTDYSRWLREGSDEIGMHVIRMGTVQLFQLGWEQNDIFSNVKFREALAYGVDWNAVGKIAMGDLYLQATSALTADSPYYTNVGNYKYDPEKAKQILQDEGLNGGDITIFISDMNVDLRKNMGEALQFYCQQIGINVELEFGDQASALSNWMAPAGTPGSSQAGWFSQTEGSVLREPHDGWMMMYSFGFPWARCGDTEFVEKALQALYTIDTNTRKELYAELQHIMYDKFLCYPVYEDSAAIGFRTESFSEQEIVEVVYSHSWFALHELSLAK
jgi:ABC-type transport system substrate-binding protein